MRRATHVHSPLRLRYNTTLTLCISRIMSYQSLLLVPTLLIVGVVTGTDAYLPCAPFTTSEHVFHTSLVTVTNRVTSYYLDGVDSKNVTFTKTTISWVTTTMTVDQTHVLPPNFITSTHYLVSTSLVSTVFTVHVTATTSFTTSVLLTTLTVSMSTHTHTIVDSSLSMSPRLVTTTTTLYTSPTVTHTYVRHSVVPPQVSTITTSVTVTIPFTENTIPPKPMTVTTTDFRTVTSCDEPHTTIIT